jgi:predicted O-linked N-acetylglucosamine transferase (SPINDLY family)
LALYRQVAIGLDPFPYHGTTTTCEALWMGVPVITLAGQTHVSRVGVSLLTNLGLPELIAQTPEEYVRMAVDLANDLPRLSHLRSTLRQRMEQSPLMDAPRFARHVEAAYRQMWRTWCAKAPAL